MHLSALLLRRTTPTHRLHHMAIILHLAWRASLHAASSHIHTRVSSSSMPRLISVSHTCSSRIHHLLIHHIRMLELARSSRSTHTSMIMLIHPRLLLMLCIVHVIRISTLIGVTAVFSCIIFVISTVGRRISHGMLAMPTMRHWREMTPHLRMMHSHAHTHAHSCHGRVHHIRRWGVHLSNSTIHTFRVRNFRAAALHHSCSVRRININPLDLILVHRDSAKKSLGRMRILKNISWGALLFFFLLLLFFLNRFFTSSFFGSSLYFGNSSALFLYSSPLALALFGFFLLF
mmetsp:Transcript_10734/g.16061  ORF Transcript_10734/g.16061 Transcript_10734/m.16061 type:complete len:289 (-) Transcript_10734:157-1023(-)